MRKKKLWNGILALAIAAAAGTVSVSAAETEEVMITLSDETILVDGNEISQDQAAAVYAGADIVYYQEGQGETYGAGSEEEAHSQEEADTHTVITITQPGTYRVTGSISKGQIAVDLGEDAKEDETAVVNLILDDAEITCTVASGIVVYHAYECGSEEETAEKEVDTEAAGFQLILADGSSNTVNGSHVAKIYKDGTTQEEVDSGEAKKKYKFDAAIDSLVSFNIDGESEKTGKLIVNADNEGISSGLHMTINGGEIEITACDDSINTNEDGLSVFTMNDGSLICNSGAGKEGDGIDSNGWIVINGGTITTCANGSSMDSGVDSDLGIYLNGGTLFASGNMYDEVAQESGQQFLVLNFAQKVKAGQILLLRSENGTPVSAFEASNDFQTMVYSSDLLADGTYTLYTAESVSGDLVGGIYTNITDYEGEQQLAYSGTSMMGMGGGGAHPEGMEPGEAPELPEGMEPGEMPEPPEGMEAGEAPELPEGMEAGEAPERPEGMEPREASEQAEGMEQTAETLFQLSGISNFFTQIREVTEEA